MADPTSKNGNVKSGEQARKKAEKTSEFSEQRTQSWGYIRQTKIR